MHKHININTDIIQVQWHNHSCTGNINKTPQYKIDSGGALYKIHESIKYNLDIFNVKNYGTFLVSVVNTSYYELVSNG